MRFASLYRRAILAVALAFPLSCQADAAVPASLLVNAELAQLFADDQADRNVPPGTSIDWELVGVRDDRREARVKALLAADALRSGADFYHAAMILQHADTPDDYLLAHDLCVIAIGKGEDRARWLAAASLDRFLINVGRRQRFGTQYESKRSYLPPRLAEVDPAVPDALRREMGVPSLAEAREKEATIARAYERRKAALRK
ncbi:hypothetical protein [Pseudoduganella chitinolytica]|uniref:Uncharacterized protein n=1 Tax=Pseudoduganella chitinolytica TaxID=34070 RepID=A0ABY8B907_9BURK|nr:hypothetical protein [Pseudoduganella chitinolytica]WEF31476.1 hypothetical protein PX653_18685 [Pseudoduganella chitinolytica]